MNEFLLPIAIALVIGLIAGVFAVRTSSRQDKVHGGLPAQIFHYLGASVFIAALPGALIELLSGRGFGGAVLASISLVITSLLLLLVYAVFERPARARIKPADEGWTAEKARTSGL
ncbi:MAG: hypothetical protein IAE80_13370 [Anaerolinea sp.]|nr:hypothetical protein [Anaerolinea sp.]